MTGSIKDRDGAAHPAPGATSAGRCGRAAPIVEATSGNTGISFAAIGRALGHPVTHLHARLDEPRAHRPDPSLGAEIRLVSREEGGFLGSIRLAEELAAPLRGAFLPRQFSNDDNVEAHALTTGPEIWWQLRFHGLQAGRVRGRRRHRRHDHGRRPLSCEQAARASGSTRSSRRTRRPCRPAARSASTASRGSRTSSSRRSWTSTSLDGVVGVGRRRRDPDGAEAGARSSGLGVGISSGANFLGALHGAGAARRRRGGGHRLPRRQQEVPEHRPAARRAGATGCHAPEVELLGFRAFKRVCHTCCDPVDCAQRLPDTLTDEERLPPCTRPRRGRPAHPPS